MKKFLICLIALVLVACNLISPAGAAVVDNEPGIEPMWDNTDSIDVTLYFENNVGTAASSVAAEFDATSITTDIFVYRMNGYYLIYVAQNHETVYDFVSGTTCEFPAVRGENYVVYYSFTVTRNGTDEVITRAIAGTYSSKYD